MKNLRIALMVAMSIFLTTACDKDKDPEEPIVVENGTYKGKMTVSTEGVISYEQENTEVKIEMGTDNTMSIEMVNVKFDSRMPITLTTMLIPGVTITTTYVGCSLSGDDIIPIAMGGPFPQFTITDLTGEVTPQKITFSMMCGTYPLSFEGTIVE